LKHVFQKQSLAANSIRNDVAEVVGLVGVCRQQVNAPVSMLGFALSVGATASVVSIPGLALAAEGSSIVVLPEASTSVQEAAEAPKSYYTVSEGDTLWHIAARHQADVDTIKTVNGISQTDVLREGQVLRLPTESLMATDAASGALGGEDLAMTEAPTSMALLSVEAMEEGWVTLEASGDLESLESNSEEATEATESVIDNAQVTGALTLATAAVAVESSTALATQPATPSASWQDAAVGLAAAPTSEVTADASTSSSALPMSMALHEEPVAAPPSVRPPAQPVAEAPQATEIPESSNASATRPETLAVVAPQPAVNAEPAITMATNTVRSREQVIQDHLARIRESNGTLVDRDMVDERIRQARLELERTRSAATTPGTLVDRDMVDERIRQARLELERTRSAATTPAAAAPRSFSVSEVNASVMRLSALMAREFTFEVDAAVPEVDLPQASGSVQPNLPARGMESQTAPIPQSGWTVTDAAVEAAAPTEVAVAPQVRLPELPAAAAPTAPAPRPTSDNLLAAAPLGPEAYRPFATMEAGQTVSPAMPLLPGSDSFLPEAPNRFAGYIWPTHGTFTSGYGWRWGRMHRGIDVAGPVGTPIVAAANGVVVRSGWNSGGYGNMVDIRHPDGSLTRYAHNSRLLVREGQQVAQGQQIAEMGSTGRSTGPHLHFEIHLPGTGTVNPMAYLPHR